MSTSARTRPRPLGKGGWLRRTILTFLALGLLGFLALVVAVVVGYQMVDVPDPNEDFQAETTFVYYSDGRHVLGEFALQNRTNVALSNVPDHVQEAVVAAENRTFWTDSGIDPKSILRAAWSNLSNDDTQGASTITQQYVKVLYLSQERSWQRKIKEAFLAVKIENQLSKEQILQGYLNTIYFGRGAYGIEAAAEAYFDNSAAELTIREGAALAAILNSPGTLDPAVAEDNRSALRERYRYVLDGMAEAGDLPAGRAADYARHLPRLPEMRSADQLGGPKGYLLTLVEDQLRQQGLSEEEIYGGGLRVTTTFDWQAQQATRAAIRQEAPTINAKGVHIAIASVEPGTGAVRAMYGGPDYVEDQRNWAMTGRQPGSSFKPFALAAGIEQGISLYDKLNGNEYVFPDGTKVRNEFGFKYGTISLLKATEVSSNTAYADLTASMEDGPEKVREAAVRAGIPTDAPALKANSRIPLGTADIRPVDMANAYATFAANGLAADWYVIDTVTGSDGAVRLDHEPQVSRVFAADVVADVTYALSQVVEDPSGTGTEAQSLGCPVAAKTGTAALRKDTVTSAWFVGYTPKLSTAVMYVRGNDGTGDLDGVGGLSTFFGGEYPARTWTAFMQQALQGQPCVGFPEPAFVTGQPPTPSPTLTPSATATTSAPTPTTPGPTQTTPPPTTPTEPPTTTPTTPPPTTPTDPPTTTPTTPPPTTPTDPPTTTPTTPPPTTPTDPPTTTTAPTLPTTAAP